MTQVTADINLYENPEGTFSFYLFGDGSGGISTDGPYEQKKLPGAIFDVLDKRGIKEVYIRSEVSWGSESKIVDDNLLVQLEISLKNLGIGPRKKGLEVKAILNN